MGNLGLSDSLITMNLITESGWIGAFTRESYSGAIPNGTSVEKTNSEPGDGHPNGTRGIVLGSIGHPDLGEIGYFVEWEPSSNKAVMAIGKKLNPLS